ncbi:MAG: hypothetical protein JO149_04390 [Gammaproteobacteria bacterium]|nr:hypothetical protein [Gammaproteobacteria bacterium]
MDIEMAKLDPASVFKNPQDVLREESLSRSQKIDILRRWAYDEREIAVAEEENMLGEGNSRSHVLEEILKSLLELGIESDQKSPPPTKHG